MRVPFIDLPRSVGHFREELLRDWEHCLDHTEFVGGPSVAALERALEKKLDVTHFVACANGTDALVIGLQALGIKPGMRVAVTNMTFWAPYEAIVQIGAQPVLIDINPDDLQMDFAEFKKAHELFRLDAAILVHLFGWTTTALGEFRTYCRAEGIRLLEDGAQAFGVEAAGESVYKEADVSTISFYPAKVLGGASDGGGIMAKDPKTAELIRSLCNHGRAGHYTYDYVGWNSRMGGLNAKFLNHALRHIDGFIDSRLHAEAFYRDFFAEYQRDLRYFGAPAGQKGNGYLVTLQARRKTGQDLAKALAQKDIGCARTYPQTLDEQPPARHALRVSDLGRSKAFAGTVINLPLFAGITVEECRAAAETLVQAL